MSWRELSLSCRDGRKALKDLKLSGQRPLGKGTFCNVYQWRDPSQVLKITVDSVAYEGIRDYFHSTALPKIIENLGIIGEQQDGRSIFAFVTKKLLPVRLGSLAHKRQQEICNLTCGSKNFRNFNDAYYFCDQLSSLEELLTEEQQVFSNLAQMASNGLHFTLDIHKHNFMVDPDSKALIFNDPVADANYI
jgi:hypothetical protein